MLSLYIFLFLFCFVYDILDIMGHLYTHVQS